MVRSKVYSGPGTGILERSIKGYNVTIDGKEATISAEIPDLISDYSEKEQEIYTNPLAMMEDQYNIIPSLSLVRFAKVKNFIDGVYATIEEGIAKKGHRLSRSDFIKNLENTVKDKSSKEYIKTIRHVAEGTKSDDVAIKKRIEIAMEDSEIITPQAFYDWAPRLRKAYTEIKAANQTPSFYARMGMDKKFNEEVIEDVMNNIKANPELRKQYNSIISLYSKLTNKMENRPSLFPSVELPDQKFFIEYSNKTQSDIEGGLGKVLVKAIKDGKINFTPKESSGLYIRQMHEIIPLIKRNTDEFSKFLPGERYKKLMEKEFISQWAGTRHTHVGHTHFGSGLIGAAISPKINIDIVPELEVEPLYTSYERMAESLEFMKDVIVSAFGEGFLDKKRLMNDGSKAKKAIGEEFMEMDLLLKGLAVISKDSIHQEYNYNEEADKARKAALKWTKNLKKDPDLNRNVAIFVPIIRTTDGEKQISYINPGYKSVMLNIEYNNKPETKIHEKKKKDEFGFSPIINTRFKEETYQIPVLVHREVRVPYEKLLNDKKLRDILDDVFTKGELDDIVNDLELGIY